MPRNMAFRFYLVIFLLCTQTCVDMLHVHVGLPNPTLLPFVQEIETAIHLINNGLFVSLVLLWLVMLEVVIKI